MVSLQYLMVIGLVMGWSLAWASLVLPLAGSPLIGCQLRYYSLHLWEARQSRTTKPENRHAKYYYINITTVGLWLYKLYILQ